MTRRHGIYPQDVAPPQSRYFDSGRFGRMFGELPPFAADTPRCGPHCWKSASRPALWMPRTTFRTPRP